MHGINFWQTLRRTTLHAISIPSLYGGPNSLKGLELEVPQALIMTLIFYLDLRLGLVPVFELIFIIRFMLPLGTTAFRALEPITCSRTTLMIFTRPADVLVTLNWQEPDVAAMPTSILPSTMRALASAVIEVRNQARTPHSPPAAWTSTYWRNEVAAKHVQRLGRAQKDRLA